MREFSALLFLLASMAAFAADYSAFAPMPKEYLTVPGEVVGVRNMPEVGNQGGAALCHAMTAWAVYMQFQCRVENSDCKELEQTKFPSKLILGGMGIGRGGKIIPDLAVDGEMGNEKAALEILSGYSKTYAEACYPLDRLIARFNGDNVAMLNAFTSLKANYFESAKAGKEICVDCLQTALQKDFLVTVDRATIAKALNHENFGKFLFDVMFKSCQSKTPVMEFKTASWPGKSEARSYSAFIGKLTTLFRSNHPVATSACLDQPYTRQEQCNRGHSLVISGYRSVCAPSGGKCSDFLKVQNSWGQGWQQTHSDGWVNAKTLFEYMSTDAEVTWIE